MAFTIAKYQIYINVLDANNLNFPLSSKLIYIKLLRFTCNLFWNEAKAM